ncbi:MAG: DUF3822 family protein [Crocinitomicaceae bacterium]
MMIPSEADAYKYALCIELLEDGFKCAIIEPKTKVVIFYNALEFDSIDEAGLKEILSEPYFKHNYKTVSISVSSSRHTIVPDAIFNASTATDLFNLNHLSPIDNLDYRRLPELGLVSIYELPLWIKSVFIKHFLRAKVNHHSTVLLKGIFSTSNYKPQAYVLKLSNLFYLAMTDKNKLVFFNAFESAAVEDLVYYFLSTAEQKGFDPAELPLTVFGLGEGDQSFKALKDLLANPVKIPESDRLQKQFILTNSLLCV